MELILLSDMHLMGDVPVARLDNIVETQLTKFAFVLDYADKRGATILQAGDMFNKPRSWLLLPKVIDLLKRHNVPVYGCFGQHDMYMYSEGTKDSTSLGILNRIGLVKILDDYTVLLGDSEKPIFVYGASWGKSIPEPANKDAFNILVTHRSVGTGPLFPGQEYNDALNFLRQNVNYNIILVGDIHRQFIIERNGRYIVNAGPMLRFTAEDYSFEHKPGFFVYSTQTKMCEFVEIPHTPAQEVLSREHLEKSKALDLMLDEFLNSFDLSDNSEANTEVSLHDNIQKIVEESGVWAEVIQILSMVMGENDD